MCHYVRSSQIGSHIMIAWQMYDSHYELQNTVVWEKFTIGYFRVKIVRGKIFGYLTKIF